MINNFIPISRKLFKHEFWHEKRAYSRFEAWLDLIASARYEAGEARMLMSGTLVRWERGELVASIRFLAERWGWTKNRVESYIRLLKSENMIKTRTANGTVQTVITICRYESYNPINKLSGQQTGQQPDSYRTTAGQQPDKTNKENKEQESKERKIYRGFAHLQLFEDEFLKLTEAGYTQKQIDQILDEIENYKNNKKYTSLYLTAKKWLQKEGVGPTENFGDSFKSGNFKTTNNAEKGGRIVQIASAFQEALQHG